MRARLPLRLARTAAFAAVCVTLAALAHRLGGGSGPAPATATAGFAAAFAAGLALAGRERSAGSISAVLVAAQFGLHELFADDTNAYTSLHRLLGSAAGPAASPGPPLGGVSAGAPPALAGQDASLLADGGPVAVHGHGGGLAVGAGMLLAHLTASLLTAWWLARGEAALWALLRRLGRRLTPLRAVAVPAPPSLVPVVRTRAVPAAPALRHSLARRGPPLPA
uniref:hypothetical protein n=1 Tax=Nonomuraea pusilla TaxID=46177 RepID=UPI0006E1F177|nr:hypothetical protein [Nonomuraea pusilla]